VESFNRSAIVALLIDKILQRFENPSHAVPGVATVGRGETHEVKNAVHTCFRHYKK
jgi:hypothetical protein